MPELQFKGKEFVYNHHLTVPYRPLEMDAKKSIGKPNLNSNLIIHGDNLHALKALLPLYAGKMDCIFIDPPYNTGNEGWCYNDNVNSPMMREWLSSNPVNSDDMLRHDKWCAMMYPRLKLLQELLSDEGMIAVTIDNNELDHLLLLMDEIFKPENRLGCAVWLSDRGNVHGFFPAPDDAPAHYDLLRQIPNLSCYGNRYNMGAIAHESLGNVLRLVRPVVVMDEGPQSLHGQRDEHFVWLQPMLRT